MDRRTFLVAGGGTVAAVAGGTAIAKATRADILADGELTRGDGEPVSIERARNSVEYLKSSNSVRENGRTEPFEEWAQRECQIIGAENIFRFVEDRFDESVEGVGRGIRHLLFGPVIAVFHTIHRDRDGAVLSEPNVSLERLISAAPQTMTVTVTLDEQEYTMKIPVGVGHVEMSNV